MRKKHKWKTQINLRRKILVVIILGVSLFVGIGYSIVGSNFEIFGTLEVSKYDRTLYTALRREVGKGYAVRYTGTHQDSMDSSKSTENIYHFYASTVDKGTEILNKNNVLFADKCWQMIRTTDTGGVKLLYNGNPETSIVNGETHYNCGNNRTPYRMGEIMSEITLGGTMIYAKNYTTSMSGNNMVYTLVDDPNDPDDYKTITINSSNAQSAITDIAENYPYTCRNTTGTCQNLSFYKVDSYASASSANVYTSTYVDRIGHTPFNLQSNSAAYIGYMYGDTYTYNTFTALSEEDFTTNANIFTTTVAFGTTYYYADSFDYGVTTANTYTLTNPVQITSSTDYSTLIGKYVMNGATSGPNVNYVIGVGNSASYVKTLSNGSIDVSIKLSDSITDNGNGTYTLDSPITTVELKNWYADYANYLGKYTCGNSTTTCASPRFIGKTSSTTYGYINEAQTITLSKTRSGLELTDYVTITTKDYFNGYDTTYADYIYSCGNNDTTCTKANLRYIVEKNPTGYKYATNHNFGSSVIYEDNKYKLQNVEGLEAIGSLTILSTHHYTCVDLGDDECVTVAYVYYFVGNTGNGLMYYMLLNDSNITNINTILNNMIGKNTTESNIKRKTDWWYEQNLKNTVYEAKLDDVIYCNDRSFTTTGDFTFERSGWNPSGGNMNQYLYFRKNGLDCENITDRFSVSNNSAKLTYKIGLLTFQEANVMGKQNVRSTSFYYWIASPNGFFSDVASVRIIGADGGIGSSGVNNAVGVRPTISLIAGTEYTKGDGSMTNPYIVKMD